LRLFLTSTQFSGNLGGLAGADQRCQTAATAGNKGGTWIALLATSTTTGTSRVTGSGPWYQEQSSGSFVVTYNNTANLQTGALATLETDEQGRIIQGNFTGDLNFWSGMNADATTTASTCSNWTTTGGSGSWGAFTSLGTSSTSCGNGYRLLCLEQSRLPRPPPPSAVRKRVFLTSTQFSGNLGGLTGADQRCQTAATAGNKGGTWIALLASSMMTGPSRVSASGPWYQERSGGSFVLTYNNAANLQTGSIATLETDEQGRIIQGNFTGDLNFWSGMNADATTSASTCSNWTTTGGSGSWGAFTSLGTSATSCGNSYRLLCLEQ
jgi:hypothetical protein